jgi:hypothetical protein
MQINIAIIKYAVFGIWRNMDGLIWVNSFYLPINFKRGNARQNIEPTKCSVGTKPQIGGSKIVAPQNKN